LRLTGFADDEPFPVFPRSFEYPAELRMRRSAPTLSAQPTAISLIVVLPFVHPELIN